jgi:hypothetical protein
MKSKLRTTAALLAGLFLLAVFVQAESAELKERFSFGHWLQDGSGNWYQKK